MGRINSYDRTSELKPGVMTSEHRIAKSGGTAGIAATFLGALIIVLSSMVPALGEHTVWGIIGGGLLAVLGVVQKTLMDLGYIKSRTLVKTAKGVASVTAPMVLMAMLGVFNVGCAQTPESWQYQRASDSYAEVLNQLAQAKIEGRLSEDTEKSVVAARLVAGPLFDEWEHAIVEGKPFNSWRALRNALSNLVRAELEVKHDRDGRTSDSG